MEEKVINGLSDISTDTNRHSESVEKPTLAGTLAADCENLGQTLRMLADKIPPRQATDRHILIEAIQSAFREDEALRDQMWELFEENIKELLRSAEVDIDAHVEINSASLRV